MDNLNPKKIYSIPQKAHNMVLMLNNNVNANVINQLYGKVMGKSNGVKSTVDPCKIKCYMLQHVTST